MTLDTPATRLTTVVFDIGHVLVHWDPHQAWMQDLGTRDAVAAFLDRVGFTDWNIEQDRGRTFAEAAAASGHLDPADAALLALYPERYALTVEHLIDGTWALLDRLKAAGIPVHAITNWSAETWITGVATHPRLGTVFGTTVVSGQEKLIKPDPAIYATLCERAGVTPTECLFIDDSPRNVAGAIAFGMDAVLFTTPERLELDLTERGLL